MHNMKRMKIRIEDPCGYEGLEGATFPLILDAKLGDKGLAYVQFSTMMQVEGWWWDEEDTKEGHDYSFFSHEYTIVEETSDDL